jgi:hypothetical protein
MLCMFGPPIAVGVNVVALATGRSKALAIPGLVISGLTLALFFLPMIARLVCL